MVHILLDLFEFSKSEEVNIITQIREVSTVDQTCGQRKETI